jgi:hypothetical protein
VSFVNDGNYIARTSNVYYLASADGSVAAMPASATSTTAKSAADSVASPGAVGWTMQVVGDCTPARCFTK